MSSRIAIIALASLVVNNIDWCASRKLLYIFLLYLRYLDKILPFYRLLYISDSTTVAAFSIAGLIDGSKRSWKLFQTLVTSVVVQDICHFTLPGQAKRLDTYGLDADVGGRQGEGGERE